MATLRKGDKLSWDYASLMPSFDLLLDAYGSLEARIAVLREHEALAATPAQLRRRADHGDP